MKLRSCRWLPVFPSGFSFVLGKIWLWLLIMTFHGQWHIFRVRCQPPIVLRVLEATCLSIARVRRLQKRDATTVLPSCACYLTLCHYRRPRNTCNPAADIFQAVLWTALVREKHCFIHMTKLNIWVEFALCTFHHTISREIPLQFGFMFGKIWLFSLLTWHFMTS